MTILICNTNLAVRTVACQVMDRPEVQYIILTDLDNVVQFFSLLNFPNATITKYQSGCSLLSIYKILSIRKPLKKLIDDNSINGVYYYHQGFGGMFNWFITYAHRKNIPITYYRVLGPYSVPLAKRSLKMLFFKYYNKFVYNADVNMHDGGGGHFTPILSDYFKTSNCIEEKKYEVLSETLAKIIDKILVNLNIRHNPKVVLLTGSVIATGQVRIEEYTAKIRLIIDSIGPENIIAKCHPRFSDEVSVEKSLPHIPSFVPMEFLLDMFPIYIGYGSTILSMACEKGKTAISCVDLMKSIDSTNPQRIHSYFANSSIIYPTDVHTLLKYITI